MKKLLSILILLDLVVYTAQAQVREEGNLVIDNAPLLPSALVEKIDQYQNVRLAYLSDWHPEKGIFVSTRFGNVNQVHHVSGPGADRRQITFFKEPLISISVCPDKARNGFIYSQDNGGNEQFQIYFFYLENGNSQKLTQENSRNIFQRWNNSGTRIAFTSNQRNPADMDLYIFDFNQDKAPVRLAELKGGGWEVLDWSNDGSQMILQNYKSINESELYRFELATRKLEPLLPTSTPVSYSAASFTKDGKGIYFISDEGSEFQTLRFLNFQSGNISALTSGITWDVESMQLSKDGTKLVFKTNEDGYSKLYVLNTRTQQYKPISILPKGVVGTFKLHDNGRLVAMDLATSGAAPDAFVIDLLSNSITRWTTRETGGLMPSHFIEPSLIHYPTFDLDQKGRRMIPAFVYKPKVAKGKTPVLINIHGGPEGQTKPISVPLTNLLVNELGVTVIKPNVRGSVGYGKTYLKLDNGAKREDSVKDIGALLDWIAQQPDLDASRVAVIGGSYGGYMSLASMTNFNDRLTCGIDIFGISNFLTFLQNTGAYRADLRRAEYGDERDPDMRAVFEKISPINNSHRITKPMLVYQGKNDPRVPLNESEQMVSQLKKQGNTVWYIMAKDEGHSLAKKANRDYVYGAILLFLQEHLVGQKVAQ